MDHKGTTITLQYTTYREMERELERLRSEAAIRGHQLAPDEAAVVDDALASALGHALVIIGFAVGNLPPETTRGWPIDDLRAFANHLDNIATAQGDTNRQSLAITLHGFANEADNVEDFRAERRREAKAVLGLDDEA